MGEQSVSYLRSSTGDDWDDHGLFHLGFDFTVKEGRVLGLPCSPLTRVLPNESRLPRKS